MAPLKSVLTGFNCILNSRQNCSNRSNSSKNKRRETNTWKLLPPAYDLLNGLKIFVKRIYILFTYLKRM